MGGGQGDCVWGGAACYDAEYDESDESDDAEFAGPGTGESEADGESDESVESDDDEEAVGYDIASMGTSWPGKSMSALP